MQNSNWGMIAGLVLLGVVVGGGLGYLLGYNKGWEGAQAEIQAAADENPFTDVKTNPLQGVETNPLKDVKTNPFE